MNKMQLSKEQITKIFGIVMFSGLFLYLYVVYFWLPTAKKIGETSKKVESIESDINKAKMQKAQYKNLEARLLDLRAQKEAAQKKLPSGKKIPDLIRTLTDQSKKYKINIQSITPGAVTKEEYFTKASYAISVTGDYHALGRFLTALGLEERILTMENLTISGTPGAEAPISATFTLIAYQYSG